MLRPVSLPNFPSILKSPLLLFSISAFFLAVSYFFFFAIYDPITFTRPDSNSYAEFMPHRSVGYPFFLYCIRSIFGTYKAAVPLQLFLYSGSSIYLAFALSRFYNQNILGFAVLGLLFASPFWISHVFQILTEGVACSLLCLMLGIVFNYGRTKKATYLIPLSLLTGLSILIRPVNYSLVPGVILFGFWAWPHVKSKIQFFIFLFMPFVIVLNLGSLGYWIKHGSFQTQSFLGFNLIGKAGLFTTTKTPSQYPEFMKSLSNRVEPVRNILEKFPSQQVRFRISQPYYDQIRYRGPIQEAFEKTGLDLSRIEKDNFWLKRAFEIIRFSPKEFLEDTWRNWMALWFSWDLIGNPRLDEEMEGTILREKLWAVMQVPGYYCPKCPQSSIKTSQSKPASAPKIRAFQSPQLFFENSQAQKLKNEKLKIFTYSFKKFLKYPAYLLNKWNKQFDCIRFLHVALFFLTSFFVILVLWASFLRKELKNIFWPLGIASLWVHSGYGVIAVLQAGSARYSASLWPCIFVVALGALELLRRYMNKPV